MKTLFLRDPWPTIIDLAHKSRLSQVAVAYLGSGASQLVPLKKGDTLVVDFSETTVKQGLTDPREIESYLNCGVKVYSYSDLHAKVYVFDDAVITSSANISEHSRTTLIEAGSVSRERRVVAAARRFIKELRLEPVTPWLVGRRKLQYKQSKRGLAKSMKGTGRSSTTSSLWLVGLHHVDRFPGKDEAESRKGGKEAAKLIKDTKDFYPYPARILGSWRFVNEVKEGDWIIQISNDEDGSTRVHEATRVLRARRYPSVATGRTNRVIVHLEERKHPHWRSWPAFRKTLGELGIRIGKDACREVRSELVAEVQRLRNN